MLNLLTLLEDVVEEIALDGLDGSTLPTLWVSILHACGGTADIIPIVRAAKYIVVGSSLSETHSATV